jgi:hypothetical protein
LPRENQIPIVERCLGSPNGCCNRFQIRPGN